MRRRIVLSLALVFAAIPAFAFRGRPLSDLRFEDRPSPVTIAGAASDGRDFLLLGASDGHVFVQRFAAGRLVARQLTIAPGTAGRIVWAGDHYLASWSDSAGTWVAPLSPEGNVLSMPTAPVLKPGGGILAVNSRSAIVVNATQAQPLDLHGRVNGTARQWPPISVGETLDDATAAGDGFALAFSGWDSTLVFRLRADGTPVTAAPTVVEGPYGGTADAYHSFHSLVAPSGDDALVVFEAGTFASDADLKTALVGPDGLVKRSVQRVYTMVGPRSLDPAGIVAAGGQYLVALGISLDPTGNFRDVDPAVLRLSSGGDRVGLPVALFTGPNGQVPQAIATNGSDVVVPWFSTDNAVSLGDWVASMPLATMTASAPQQIGRSVDEQTNVAIGAREGQYLAAWIETTADTRTVRASRLDRAGNYLDGPGLVVATTGVPPRFGYAPTVSVESDGINWLVVWADGVVRAARISPLGVVIDRTPITLGPGEEAAVRWNGANYVVVFSDGSLYSIAISRDGTPGTQRTLAQLRSDSTIKQFRSPAIAALGGRFLVAFSAHESGCFTGPQPACFDSSAVVGLRLDASGAPLDAGPFAIGGSQSDRAAVASDGSSYFVAWSAGEELRGALLSGATPQQGGTAFLMDSKAEWPALAYNGHDFVMAWQRWSERTIVTGRIRDGILISSDPMSIDGSEVAFSKPDVAATASMPPLIAYTSQHSSYAGVPRAMALFATEIETAAALIPAAPSIISAVRLDPDTVFVQWEPVPNALGVGIELRAADGTYRQIGVAAGGASSGRGSLAGLTGVAVRVRAWNSAGLSVRSLDVPLVNIRSRVVGR